MTEIDEIRSDVRSLHDKLDRALALLDAMQSQKARAHRAPKVKPEPPSAEEVEDLQTEFTRLYERWVNEDEFGTQQELDKLDVEQLRRLADANNLNVTAKMSKEKVLHLIAARFREKRQLLKPTGYRDKTE